LDVAVTEDKVYALYKMDRGWTFESNYLLVYNWEENLMQV